MAHVCEVCARLGSNARGSACAEPFLFGGRPVLLCRGHARIAANSNVISFEGLRALYGSGRRSFIERRRPGANERKERRRSPGRRASDSV